jgi:AcrR family transcriptional regulator
MRSPEQRGAYTKGIKRRKEIINAATSLLATQGFTRTTLKQVAQLVGVTEATLFHYFGGKQELLTAVLAERDRRELADMGAAEPGLRLLATIAERHCRQPGLSTLYAAALATATDSAHDSHAYFQEQYAALLTTLVKDLEKRQEIGSVRSDVPAITLARMGSRPLRRPASAVALRQDSGHSQRALPFYRCTPKPGKQL